MIKTLFITLKIWSQYILPKYLLTRLAGMIADAKMGWFSTYLIKHFIKQYKVNMDEAKYSDPLHFDSFNEFFTRKLKDGVRPILAGDENIISPVDGKISQVGHVKEGRLIQAKGRDFSLRELLGGLDEIAIPFKNGLFSTIYLSPKDYHRIHIPIAAKLEKMLFIPGNFFSVNPLLVDNIPNLFSKNERAVALFTTACGPMAMVLVGALIVRSIETVWHGVLDQQGNKEVQFWDYSDQNITFEKGDEIGRFRLGSTIIAIFSENSIVFADEIIPGASCRLGSSLAVLQKSSD
ncbi:MAG: phosphatidylserine decarboxylase [Psychromonas sp.]|nr:phosphatidylserine decarboxylase [Psychromonas sp.]